MATDPLEATPPLEPAGHRSEVAGETFAPDPEELGYVIPGVDPGPPIGPWKVYAVIIVALVVAGWLSTRRLVGSAEALPYGSGRSVAVTAVSLVHHVADLAGLTKPDREVQVVLGRPPQDDAGEVAAALAVLSQITTARVAPRPVGAADATIAAEPTKVVTATAGATTVAEAVPSLAPAATTTPEGTPTAMPRRPGRGATRRAPGVGLAPPTTAPGAVSPGRGPGPRGVGRVTPAPTRSGDGGSASTPPAASATPVATFPVGAPTPPPSRVVSTDAPLRVLVAGDSQAEPLGYEMWNHAAEDNLISAAIDFRISSSLVRPDYFDWPRRMTDLMAAAPAPEAVIFDVGGNADQNFSTANGIAEIGTPAWEAEYRKRAEGIMDIVHAAGARLYWVGLPPIADERHNIAGRAINHAVAAEAAARGDVTFVDIAPMFAGPDGGFAPYVPDADGTMTRVRQDDGVHLTRTGTNWVAAKVYAMILDDWAVRPATPTPASEPVGPGAAKPNG